MTSNKYEFFCPQFVDFCSGIEGVSSDEGCFGSAFPDKRSELFLKSNFRCQVPKPIPRIRILSSTPVNKQSFVNTSCRSNTTDSEKVYRRRKILKRQSKSLDSLHGLGEEKELFPAIGHRRSISASDNRPKKMTRPITPECLKRSLYSSKNKTFKTTEELELEKIALLQKQMSNNLRANEVAMRRLKIKQAWTMQRDSFRKETQGKMENAENLQNGHSSFVERISVCARNICSRLPRDIAKGQYQSSLAGPSNAALTSGKKEAGIYHNPINKNLENIKSMQGLGLPKKSRRCLFQEIGRSPY